MVVLNKLLFNIDRTQVKKKIFVILFQQPKKKLLKKKPPPLKQRQNTTFYVFGLGPRIRTLDTYRDLVLTHGQFYEKPLCVHSMIHERLLKTERKISEKGTL